MPLDGHFIHQLRTELQGALAGARADKIHNPAKEEFVLHLRSRTGVYKLLLCLNPGRARANLITQAPENPAQPGMFCMLLRKHLQGAALTEIRQPQRERILFFDFAGTSEIGEPVQLTLCAQFTGKHTNLLLLRADGTIIDCLKRGDLTQTEHPALPGLRYELPPGNGYIPPPPPADPRPYLRRNADGVPTSYGLEPPGEEIESYSRLLEIYFDERDKAGRKQQQAGALRKLVENRIARLRRKLAAQQKELEAAQDREQLRIYAELILANRARLEQDLSVRGSSGYRLENYYDNGQMVNIPVSPALGPAGNAQRYFKEYRKAKTAASLLGGFIAEGEQQLAYLESVADFLQRAETAAEIEGIRHELELQGYCKKSADKKHGKQRQAPQAPPLEYISSEGLRIFAGRNNLQNDQLSLKTAMPGDLWFHTRGYAGAHVILRAEHGQTPGAQSIEEAAMIAAWHSQARSGAEVDYTPAKILKKPNGAPPGKVIYHTCQTIYARPTEERIQALQKK